MSSNIIDFGEKLKKRVLISSEEMFNKSLTHGIKLGFSMQEFEAFNQTIYQLYQSKKNTAHYVENMNLFITNAITSKIESPNRVLKLEDILDSIWDVTVNKDKTIEKVKAKYLEKFYKSM